MERNSDEFRTEVGGSRVGAEPGTARPTRSGITHWLMQHEVAPVGPEAAEGRTAEHLTASW